MKSFFTSDTHFGHERVLVHDKRPFANVDEMDNTIIENWNKVVGERDEVYHVGDFCFRSAKSAEWYLNQLNGRIHIVWGNHDDHGKNCAWKYRQHFASYQDYKYFRLNGQKIALLHYKMQVWRSSHHGSWHLFGHSHGNLESGPGKCLDVGTMCHGYRPISFEEAEAYMCTRGPTFHHSV